MDTIECEWCPTKKDIRRFHVTYAEYDSYSEYDVNWCKDCHERADCGGYLSFDDWEDGIPMDQTSQAESLKDKKVGWAIVDGPAIRSLIPGSTIDSKYPVLVVLIGDGTRDDDASVALDVTAVKTIMATYLEACDANGLDLENAE